MTSPMARIGALALAVATIFSVESAYAQATKPAAPAAPAQPQPQGQPQGPIKLDLVGLQSPWTKVCNKDPSGTHEMCRITRDFGQAADQPPALAFAFDMLTGEEKRQVHVLLPLGLLLRPGFRMIMDGKGDPIEGKFDLCFQNGCFATADLNAAAFASVKKTQTLAVVVRNQGNLEVTFNVPMKEFAAALDGPAVDPKVLEQQNEDLQKKLEENARKQREMLEKQGQNPQAAPAPAAPAK